jgi:hypothetical protein
VSRWCATRVLSSLFPLGSHPRHLLPGIRNGLSLLCNPSTTTRPRQAMPRKSHPRRESLPAQRPDQQKSRGCFASRRRRQARQGAHAYAQSCMANNLPSTPLPQEVALLAQAETDHAHRQTRGQLQILAFAMARSQDEMPRCSGGADIVGRLRCTKDKPWDRAGLACVPLPT